MAVAAAKTHTPPIRSQVQQNRNCDTFGQEPNQELAAPKGEEQARQRAHRREEEAFNHELPNGLPGSGSQRDAGADLVAA